MKFLLFIILIITTSCSQKEKAEVPPENPKTENNKFPELYIFEVGLTHFFEETLEGYKLKAAIVNDLHSLLFYYSEEKQQVYFYVEEILTSSRRDTLVLKVNGEDVSSIIRVYLVEKDGERKLVEIDGEQLTDQQRKEFKPPGMSLGYGIKLKRNDKLEFRMTLSGNREEQVVEINYEPNKGWSSKASEIKYFDEPVVGNVFCFAKEKMIDQLQRASKSKKGCIVRDKIALRNGWTLKLVADNNYGDFSGYPIEVEVGEKSILVDGKSYTFDPTSYQHRSFFSAIGWALKLDDLRSDDLRITVSEKSNDKVVRGLFKFLLDERVHGKYMIGFK